MSQFSSEYIHKRKVGPFPNHIDPWAENGRYFQQIHAGMIGALLEQIQDPLESLGYVAGRETSLQIAEHRQPDIYIQNPTTKPIQNPTWDYAQAAQDILAEPGISIDLADNTQALYITEVQSGELVTIVEIISPRNKSDLNLVVDYQARRSRFLAKGINIVEIDITRSVKRLLSDQLADQYPYHIAVYIPQAAPRLIGVEFNEPLKRIALPLRGEVIPMELQLAYQYAYQVARIATHIMTEEGYAESSLPFPSLLTSRQKRNLSQTVAQWMNTLKQLEESKSK